MFLLEDYNYNLPKNLIADIPNKKRDNSKLLILDKKNGDIKHKKFCDICDFLQKGDLLVVNNSKVVPARLFGEKESGGNIEILILDYFKTKSKTYLFLSDKSF